MRLGQPFRSVASAVLGLGLGIGPASGCAGGNDDEIAVSCEIQPDTATCVCSRKEGGDRTSCTPADVGNGACFGKGDYCACRPWRCWGTANPCSCEFGGAHTALGCEGSNCCFLPDQNGGFCNCLDPIATCPGVKVDDCNFATIEPLLADTDGTFPRVDACPL